MVDVGAVDYNIRSEAMLEDDNVTIFDCPKCNGKLVIRVNSKTEEKFLGCSNYPKCKYTQPVEPGTTGDED